MLVLSRKAGEEILIGDNIRVVINRIAGNRVTIGVTAPEEVRIVRGELRPIVDAFTEVDERIADAAVPLPTDLGLGDTTSTTYMPKSAR